MRVRILLWFPLVLRITPMLLTTAYNSQSLLASVFLFEPTFFLSHLHLQPKKPSFCSSSTASYSHLKASFHGGTLLGILNADSSLPFTSKHIFFFHGKVSQILYLKCMPCHSFVSDCLMTLITIFICRIYVLSHWLSPPQEDEPFEGRGYICLVHTCIASTYKNAWHIVGNSINIGWMNKKEATRVHCQGGKQRNRPSGHHLVCWPLCVGHLVYSTHLWTLPMGTWLSRQKEAHRRWLNHWWTWGLGQVPSPQRSSSLNSLFLKICGKWVSESFRHSPQPHS